MTFRKSSKKFAMSLELLKKIHSSDKALAKVNFNRKYWVGSFTDSAVGVIDIKDKLPEFMAEVERLNQL